VQIARFADISEAQIAASALRASGIPAVVRDGYGQNTTSLQKLLAASRARAADAKA